MVYFDQNVVASGAKDLADLRDDVAKAQAYGDDHLGSLGRCNGGKIYEAFLAEHTKSVEKFGELVSGSRTLLNNAKLHVDSTVKAYADTENTNTDEVAKIWNALEKNPKLSPVGPASAGASAGPLPSAGLKPPDSKTDDWIWKVLSWPDYLSISSWARTLLNYIASLFGIADLWAWLWEWIGGDFNKISCVSSAWFNLEAYYRELGSELKNRMSIMFTGWYDSADATAAGDYFAKAAKVLGGTGGVPQPLHNLGDLYNTVSLSSFWFYQAIFSAVDALVDQTIAAIFEAGSLMTAIAAIFSGGLTAIPAAIAAFIALMSQVSAMWGWMMTAVYGYTGLIALLGAATTDVNWVTLPEG